jgi:hypothetical protein
LQRILIAKRRIQSILDRDTVCHQKTLEQKISEQGPRPLRVDPHLVSKAILDLLEQNRLATYPHKPTNTKPWYANPGTTQEAVRCRLEILAPLYDQVSGHGFGNLTGDALEIIVFKCLRDIYLRNRRYSYQGSFHLSEPKDRNGRYRKTEPPKTLGDRTSSGLADFYQFGHAAGTLCIECKNLREWMYPDHGLIKELIIKASELGSVPVLVARRLHYTTRANLLRPAGIIAHESLLQYYPPEAADIAAKVKDARLLGFTDVTPSEDPHQRTIRFFSENLPTIVDYMSERWFRNEQALLAFAHNEMNISQLYTEIGSVAGGKWEDRSFP